MSDVDGLMLSPLQLRVKSKQVAYQDLTEKFGELDIQIRTTRDADEKLDLTRKQKNIEEKMETAYAELQELKEQLQSGDSSQRRRQDNVWESKICKIDYKKAHKIFDKVLGKLGEDCGDVLFLLQKSASMGGKWCIQELRERIERLPGVEIEPRQYSFESYERANSQKIINDLISIYTSDEDKPKTEPVTTERIIKAINASLFTGAVFYIQIDIRCKLDETDLFIHWFIDDFWRSLKTSVSPDNRNRLIAVIAVDGDIPRPCLSEEFWCKRGRVESRKVLELPLELWKETDISKWLLDCSGLGRPPIHLTVQQMEAMASSIYGSSGGQPVIVYSQLKEQLSRYVG